MFHVSERGFKSKPETLSGFKQGGFNETLNSFRFQKGVKLNLKPFRVSKRGVKRNPKPFLASNEKLKSNPKPFGVSNFRKEF